MRELRIFPMRMKLFKIGLVAIVPLISCLYAGYWFYVAHELRAGIEPTSENLRAQGIDLHWEQAEVEGFPVRFRINLVAPVLTTNYRVTAPSLAASASVWNLRDWHIDLPQGAKIDLPLPESAVHAETVSGMAHLAEGFESRITLAATHITGDGAARAVHIDGATLAVTGADQGTTQRITLELAGVALEKSTPPFPNMIEQISLDTEIHGPVPSTLKGSGVAAWQAGGGRIDIKNGGLHWGQISVTSKGMFALDSELQPEGELESVIEGQDRLIEAVAASGRMSAQNAKMMLKLFTKPAPEGGDGVVLSLRLQQHHAYLGPLDLGSIPPIHWE